MVDQAKLILHQFPQAWGMQPSPFCLKVETYLRMAGLTYTTVDQRDPRKAPKGKLPYLTVGGRTVADSEMIVDYLKSTYGDTLDGRLTAEEQAVALAFRRLIEEHLYFAFVYFRWMDTNGWAVVKPAYFGAMPAPLRWFVPQLAKAGVRKTLLAQGIGRHGADGVAAKGGADLAALSTLLADKPYLQGAEPSSLDASAYGVLANILHAPVASALKARAVALENLRVYCNRIRERYFSS